MAMNPHSVPRRPCRGRGNIVTYHRSPRRRASTAETRSCTRVHVGSRHLQSGGSGMSRLLESVRVIECAALRNGDNLGMLLGDLGADVIKVESPGRGDYLRIIGGQITPQHSRAHVQFNRNKRSITIDLRSAGGPSGVLGPARHCGRLRRRVHRRRLRQARRRLRTSAGAQSGHRVLPIHGVRRAQSVCPDSHARSDDGCARRQAADRHGRRRLPPSTTAAGVPHRGADRWRGNTHRSVVRGAVRSGRAGAQGRHWPRHVHRRRRGGCVRDVGVDTSGERPQRPPPHRHQRGGHGRERGEHRARGTSSTKPAIST